jgi:hypothetical protein
MFCETEITLSLMKLCTWKGVGTLIYCVAHAHLAQTLATCNITTWRDLPRVCECTTLTPQLPTTLIWPLFVWSCDLVVVCVHAANHQYGLACTPWSK